MSNVEKSTQATEGEHTEHLAHHPVLDMSSWKYKATKLGPLTIPPYASPEAQLFLVSMVCFLCPGMFNALSGLGAGGGTDPRAADDANIALYSTFAVVGFFAGTFANKLGIKVSLSFGGLGYCVYCIAFLIYKKTHNYGLQCVRWLPARLLCRHPVVRPGRYHDVVSAGTPEGSLHLFLLDRLQPRRCDWQPSEPSSAITSPSS